MDFLAELRSSCSRSADRVALAWPGGEVTYREVWRAVGECAEQSRRAGIGPGACTVWPAQSHPQAVVVMLGLLLAGSSVVPVSGRRAASTVCTEVPGVSHLVGGARGSELPGERVGRLGRIGWTLRRLTGGMRGGDRAAGPPEIWLGSSGTTGAPKYARLGLAGCAYNATVNAAALDVSRQDRTLQLLPLHYSYGLIGQLFTHLLAGAATVLAPSEPIWSDRAVGQLARHVRASSVFLVPPLVRLLRAGGARTGPPDPCGLRLITVGGDALDEFHFRFLRGWAPDARIAVTYGLVEAGPRVSTYLPTEAGFREGAVGFALPGTSVLVDTMSDNAVLVHSPSLMLGYAGSVPPNAPRLRPPGTALAGWLETRDVGAWSKRHGLVLRGRRQRSFVVQGRTIYLDQVERRLLRSGEYLTARTSWNPDRASLRIAVQTLPGTTVETRTIEAVVAEAVGMDPLPFPCEFPSPGDHFGITRHYSKLSGKLGSA